MSREEFITKIAPFIQKYAPLYDIRVCSPIIAQAVLESAGGTSELATKCNNYFGLKWREGRCPTAKGYYVKTGSEQNPDGSYTSSVMKWMKFDNMENGVIGYFDFTINYTGLKGVTDPRTYLENIKKNGYATSLEYVNNVMKVIDTYDLTRFDAQGGDKMLRICLSAGHGPETAGKRCMKKLDPKETREYFLNSRIATNLEEMLKSYCCEVLRVDDVKGKTDVSNTNRAKKSNEWGADIYISIHHNAGILGKLIGYKNKKAGGTVVYYSSSKPERLEQAKNLYENVVAKTGLVGDRASTVIKKGFTEIAKADAPSFLIENGFMDSPTDVPIILSENHAKQTALGILQFLQDSFKLKAKEDAPHITPGVSKDYLVKVVTDTLSFVDEPPKIKGEVKKGEVYTITEERDGYGKLKSGAGWLALYGTERV